jgi:5-formyltetrahydrofolate cyclo-ligase
VNSKEKSQLRKQARDKRRALTDSQRSDASSRICQRIASSKGFRNARRIAFYLPFDEEVDCLPLLELAMGMEKQVFLPQLPGSYPRAMNFASLDANTALETGPLGTIQPCRTSAEHIAPRALDLVITPLVAFDPTGNRIGMGAGYYDRTFAFLRARRHWIRPRLIGVAFECQQVDFFESDPWDIPLWSIVTESSCYPGSRII